MSKLLSAIEKAETIAIGGHVRPDGDCIGSCMGLFRYIKRIIRTNRSVFMWKRYRMLLIT